MKTFFIIFILSTLTFASDSSPKNQEKSKPFSNPNEQDTQDFMGMAKRDSYTAGGGISFTQWSNRYGNGFEYSINPSLQYFFLEDLSFGATMDFWSDSGGPLVAALGPIAQFYFYKHDALALKVGLNINKGLTSATVVWYAGAFVGLEYFLNPNVSLGSTLSFFHYAAKSYNYQRSRLLFNTSVYF